MLQQALDQKKFNVNGPLQSPGVLRDLFNIFTANFSGRLILDFT